MNTSKEQRSFRRTAQVLANMPGILVKTSCAGIHQCQLLRIALQTQHSHWAGNDHGYGWESHKSLIVYKLIEEVSHRTCAKGFRRPELNAALEAIEVSSAEAGNFSNWEELRAAANTFANALARRRPISGQIQIEVRNEPSRTLELSRPR